MHVQPSVFRINRFSQRISLAWNQALTDQETNMENSVKINRKTKVLDIVKLTALFSKNIKTWLKQIELNIKIGQ